MQLAREAVEFGDERCLVVVDSVLGQLHQMTHRLFAEMQLQIQIREIHLWIDDNSIQTWANFQI